jgi:hypothetical protein
VIETHFPRSCDYPDHAKLLNKFALSEDEVEDLLDRYSDGLNDTSNERGYDYRVCR